MLLGHGKRARNLARTFTSFRINSTALSLKERIFDMQLLVHFLPRPSPAKNYQRGEANLSEIDSESVKC